MDLPAPLLTTQSSNAEVKNENSIVVSAASKRARFLSTYQRQSFSLPSDSIMHYITKNPTSPKLYEKMIQTCKYFYVKNPILVISGLQNYNNKWFDGIYGITNSKKYDMTKFLCKFWITKRFYVGPNSYGFYEEINPNLVYSITPKLYRCVVSNLNLNNQIISYSDLPLLISNAERIILKSVTVKDENGSNVPLEKIFEAAVNAKHIELYKPTITSNTMKELLKIPHFAKFKYISMSLASEDFDIETFYNYITTNYQQFWLRFVNPISDAYKSRLNKFVDNILASEVFNFKPPFIQFDGIDPEKSRKIFHFYRTL